MWMVNKQLIFACCPGGWGYRVHWLHPCWRVRAPPVNECPGYETKQSDGEALVTLEFWGNAEYSFIANAFRSTLDRSGGTW